MNPVDQEIYELIQADIDGQVSNTDCIRLQEYLENDSEARQLCEEYRRMVASLEAMPELDPPVGLTAAVMAAARLSEKQGIREPRPSFFAAWFEFPVLGYSLAFLIGALLASGISQLRLADPTGMSVAGLGGTMSPVRQFQPLRSYQLEGRALQGQVDLTGSDQSLRLHFSLDNSIPVEVIVNFEGKNYYLSGFSQQKSEPLSLTAAASQVALLATGEQQFMLQLGKATAAASSIEVSFKRDGETIYSLAISPDGDGSSE